MKMVTGRIKSNDAPERGSIARGVDRWKRTGFSTLGKKLPLGLSKNQQGQSNRTESRQRGSDRGRSAQSSLPSHLENKATF